MEFVNGFMSMLNVFNLYSIGRIFGAIFVALTLFIGAGLVAIIIIMSFRKE